jgi:hypothetical protein
LTGTSGRALGLTLAVCSAPWLVAAWVLPLSSTFIPPGSGAGTL